MSRSSRPQFQLQNVYEDSIDVPQLYDIGDLPEVWHVPRRSFLGLTGWAATVLAACGGGGSAEQPPPQGQNPAPAPAPAIDTKACDYTFRAHERFVSHVVSRDGHRMFATHSGSELKIWDASTARLVRAYDVASGNSSAMSEDGREFIWLGTVTFQGVTSLVLRRWDVVNASAIDGFSIAGLQPTVLSYSPDGSQLAAATQDNEVWLIDLATTQVTSRLPKSTALTGRLGYIGSVAYSRNAQRLATGSVTVSSGGVREPGGEVWIWDLTSEQVIRSLPVASAGVGAIHGLHFLPNGLLLVASGSEEAGVEVWDTDTGTMSYRITTGRVYDISVNADSTQVAVGFGRKNAAVFDIATGAKVYELNGAAGLISFVGQNRVATVVASNVQLWEGGELLPDNCLVDPPSNHTGTEVRVYEQIDQNGIEVVYTVPCGSPVPAGAVCTCDCVPGSSAVAPSDGTNSGSGSGGGSRCSCVPVCTCVPVRF